MDDFVTRERAQCELAPYGVADDDQLKMMLDDSDFMQALAVSMHLLGSCFTHRPVEGGSLDALQAIRNMDVVHDWPFGRDEVLVRAASMLDQGQTGDPHQLDLEFQRLFHGTGPRVAPPFGSVYMDHDQVINGWTWMALRDWMRIHGLTTRYEENEPEDQFGRMLVLAGDLASFRPDLLAEFLGDHLLCWSGHFLKLFQSDELPVIYRGLAVLAAATLDGVREMLGVVPARRRFYR